MTLKIGVDLDGVTADLFKDMIKILNKKTGKNLTMADVTQYDVTGLWGIGRQTLEESFAEVDWVNLDLLPGAAQNLQALKRLDYELHILTYRVWKKGIHRETIDWVKKHEIPFDSIHFSKDKLPLARSLGLDVMIEDAPHYAEEFNQARIPLILMNRPYNQGVDGHYIHRVNSWNEAFVTIKTLEPWNGHPEC